MDVKYFNWLLLFSCIVVILIGYFQFKSVKKQTYNDKRKIFILLLGGILIGVIILFLFSGDNATNYTSAGRHSTRDSIITGMDSLTNRVQGLKFELSLVEDMLKNPDLDIKSKQVLIEYKIIREKNISNAQLLVKRFNDLPILNPIQKDNLINDVYSYISGRSDSNIVKNIGFLANQEIMNNLHLKIEQYAKLLDINSATIQKLRDSIGEMFFALNSSEEQNKKLLANIEVLNIRLKTAEDTTLFTQLVNKIKSLQQDTTSMRSMIDSIEPVYAQNPAAILTSKRGIRIPRGKDCFNVHRRELPNLKKIQLIIKFTADFTLQKGVKQIRVYASCQPPPNSKNIFDTQTIIIKGDTIRYNQPIFITEENAKKKTVSFNLQPGFLSGDYEIKLYSTFKSVPFCSVVIKICK
jgi:hypothetical protein